MASLQDDVSVKEEKPFGIEGLRAMVRHMHLCVTPVFCYARPADCARITNQAYVLFRETVDRQPEKAWAQTIMNDVILRALEGFPFLDPDFVRIENPAGGCMAVLLVLNGNHPVFPLENEDAYRIKERVLTVAEIVKIFDVCVAALKGAATGTMRFVQQGPYAFAMVEQVSASKSFRVEVDLIPVLRGLGLDSYFTVAPTSGGDKPSWPFVAADVLGVASSGSLGDDASSVASVTSTDKGGKLVELSIMGNQYLLQDLVDDCPRLADVLALFVAMQYYGAFRRAPVLRMAHTLSFHAVVLDLARQMGHREFIDWWRYSQFTEVFLTIGLAMVRHFVDDVPLQSVTHDLVDALADVRALDRTAATQYYTDWFTNDLSFSVLFH